MKNLLTVSLAFAWLALSSFNPAEGVYNVNPGSTDVKWTGYHLAKSYEHYGNIKVKKGSLVFGNGNITGGEVIIDMNSITVGDIAAGKDNAKLVGHLKSDDFFAVEKYPEARLLIKKSVNTPDGLAITGDLTIRDVTKEVTFNASVKENSNNSLEALADIRVKRTDYKVMYGWKVENAILSDEFRLEIKLVASK